MSGKTTGKQFAQLEATLDMIRRSQEEIAPGPAMISWLRILLVPLCIWCGLHGNLQGLFWLTLAAAASDYFDGWLARRMKVSSTPGKTLDMLADKFFLSVMLIFTSGLEGIHIDPVFLLIPAWYHITVALGLTLVSWSIGIPVVAITTSERLTIILSYILVITAAGCVAYTDKSIFKSLIGVTAYATSIAAVLGTVSYFRFSRRLIQRYMK